MSFLSRKFLLVYYKQEILAVVHLCSSRWTNYQPWIHLLQIAGPLETPATCSYTLYDSSWVERTSWLSLIPFWTEANYIFLRTSHFFSLSSSSPFAHQQSMAPQTPQQGEGGSESSRPAAAWPCALPTGTQLQCRHHLVHCDAADAATENMTLDTHL